MTIQYLLTDWNVLAFGHVLVHVLATLAVEGPGALALVLLHQLVDLTLHKYVHYILYIVHVQGPGLSSCSSIKRGV